MAKKKRPSFSAPPTERPAPTDWVYRTDRRTPAAAPPQAPPAAPRSATPRSDAARKAAPRSIAPPSGHRSIQTGHSPLLREPVVRLSARMLLPVAILDVLVVTPLAAWLRRGR
jgi:hypothetical protein